METISETHARKSELEARLADLEQRKASLEGEISTLVEQIPIIELSRHMALLESETSSLRLVRDMLRSLVHDDAEKASPSTPSN
jgi:uncharacterized coiled-coil protein SlyX